MNSKIRLIFIAVFLVSVQFFITASVQAQVVAPGQYKCWTPKQIINDPKIDDVEAAKIVSGYCIYRGRGHNGKSGFNKLVSLLYSMIKRDAPKVANYIPPTINDSEYTITWWLEGSDPALVHPSNHVIGKQLQQADVIHPFTKVDNIEIRAMVFSIDQTKSREIGMSIASNFSKNPDSPLGPFTSKSLGMSLGNGGIFDIVGAVADPLANAIRLGFNASSQKLFSKELMAGSTVCPLGEHCTFKSVKTNILQTSLKNEKGELGIRFSMRPLAGVKDDEIKLEMLNIFIGLETGDEASLSNEIAPINHSTYVVRDGELHILGSYTRETFFNEGKLLGKASGSVFSKMIFLVSATRKKQGSSKNYMSNRSEDLTYTKAELKALDENLNFLDVLGSLKKVCFDDVTHPNPMRSEPICGFHFTEMSPKFINYWMDIQVDSKKSLKYTNEYKKRVKLGDLYKGKGYYQLPLLLADRESHNMKIKFEISKSGSGKDIRKLHRSKKVPSGLKFNFTHTANSDDPIDIQKSSVKAFR